MSDETIDPLSNVIAFTRKKREPSLAMIVSSYDSCRHETVYVNEEKRLVKCQKCSVILDPFHVLWQMAVKERRWLSDLEAWEAKRDSELADRYDLEWQRTAKDITEPPTDPELLPIWKTFHSYMGDSFCGMYRLKRRKTKGTLWYGRNTNGGRVSLEYARMRLVQQVAGENR